MKKNPHVVRGYQVPKYSHKKGKKMQQVANQSQGDRERSLWIASRMYLTGEINSEKLEEIESSYTEDFNNALIALSTQDVSHDLFARILKICKPKS